MRIPANVSAWPLIGGCPGLVEPLEAGCVSPQTEMPARPLVGLSGDERLVDAAERLLAGKGAGPCAYAATNIIATACGRWLRRASTSSLPAT